MVRQAHHKLAVIMEKILIANWKMNPLKEKAAVELARLSDKKNIVIAAPFIYLPILAKIIRKAGLAGQDVFWKEKGAYTGEISPLMLKQFGVKYIIIGHSERRYIIGETNTVINKKIKAALVSGLKVVLCIGESLKIRNNGLAAVKNFIKNQLKQNLKGIKIADLKNLLLIAYEPIWAIGTGRSDKPAETIEIFKFLKKFLVKSYKLPVKVLYGGSVNAKNIDGFLNQPEIDGLLVGGASYDKKELKIILDKFRKIKKS